jgi:hypothetical protein
LEDREEVVEVAVVVHPLVVEVEVVVDSLVEVEVEPRWLG